MDLPSMNVQPNGKIPTKREAMMGEKGDAGWGHYYCYYTVWGGLWTRLLSSALCAHYAISTLSPETMS